MKLSELYEDSTVPQLNQNIIGGFPETRKRQYATDTIRITQLRIIPYVGVKSLYISGVAHNTDGNMEYQPQVFFGGNIEYRVHEDAETIKVTASNQKEYNLIPIELDSHTARVRCNCADFYWRFAHYNFHDRSLVGPAPKPYQKKSDRPPVNPQQIPGLCKHLLKLIDTLEQGGLVY